jgi:xanthine dehydrogenase accessory factor
VGGVHIAIPLVTFGKALGFRAILIDPRESFGNAKRFPHADKIVSEWPDRALEALAPNPSTAIAVLTHDPRLDDPALVARPSRLRRGARKPPRMRSAARACSPRA